MTRVVITGMGAVAPNGNGIQEFISNSFAGKVGIKAIKKFDAKPTGITVAGEIDDFDLMMSSGEKLRAEWIFILNTPYKALLKQWKWRRLTKQIPSQSTWALSMDLELVV